MGRMLHQACALVVALLCTAAAGQGAVVPRCAVPTQDECLSDLSCRWSKADSRCFLFYTIVGEGECLDGDGLALARYVSISTHYATGQNGVVESQCEAACSARPDCLGIREMVVGEEESTRCVLYAGAVSANPPRDFRFTAGNGTTVVAATGQNVQEKPTQASGWVCKARVCDFTDCACAQPRVCGMPRGFKGACECVTPTVSATQRFSPTPSLSVSSTATLTGTVSPTLVVYDECEGRERCGLQGMQNCTDPFPYQSSLNDYVCRCRNSNETEVGRPVSLCTIMDECAETPQPCYAGQTCFDPKPFPASRFDFECVCSNDPTVKNIGAPVPASTCGMPSPPPSRRAHSAPPTAKLQKDECSPSPCYAPQTCVDLNTSALMLGDYICTCPNGGPRWQGRSMITCGMCDSPAASVATSFSAEYDECASGSCGLGQDCVDPNRNLNSLGDFECRCRSTGVKRVALPVSACPVVDATAAPANGNDTETPAPAATASDDDGFPLWIIFLGSTGALFLLLLVVLYCATKAKQPQHEANSAIMYGGPSQYASVSHAEFAPDYSGAMFAPAAIAAIAEPPPPMSASPSPSKLSSRQVHEQRAGSTAGTESFMQYPPAVMAAQYQPAQQPRVQYSTVEDPHPASLLYATRDGQYTTAAYTPPPWESSRRHPLTPSPSVGGPSSQLRI